MVNAAIQRFQSEPLDGYDLFLLEAAKAAGISKVITDDGDFSGVPGIQMFTKNQRVLTAAQTRGKLVVR
jgi:predicted nucleic acid-binding protein